jgi:hypothetical protein
MAPDSLPASSHLVGRPPAAITREDHSAPCFVLEREHANDGVQISPQEQCRSRRRSLAPPFQRDDCGPRMKQITSSSQAKHGQFQEYFRGSDRAMTHVSIYAPRNLKSLRLKKEIEPLFCLRMARELPQDKHVDNIRIHEAGM